MVPAQHGATTWKHWIFCPTDHLDFENLKNRRRCRNPGKPRTAGLCGWTAGFTTAVLYLVLFSAGQNRRIYPQNRRCSTTSHAVFLLEIPSQNVLANLRPHGLHTARSLFGVRRCHVLGSGGTQTLTSGDGGLSGPGGQTLAQFSEDTYLVYSGADPE